MKRIVASVGLVALGAASVQAQSTVQGQSAAISAPPPKWWSVSATVQGFYDDNANTAPSGVKRISTFGYELSPSVGVSIGNQQTTFTATYVYDLLYYAKPLVNFYNSQHVAASTSKYDQDHTFTMELDHAFSERYSVHVTDSFIIGQEPDALRTGNPVVAFQRISGNNIVNSAGITVDGVLTPLLGFEAGYNNGWYDYDADELSGPLNRDENYAHLDLRWNVAHETVGVLGYQFGDVSYDGTGPYANPYGFDNTDHILPSVDSHIDVRDTISHTVYLGADHTFLPNLLGSVRVGATYYDYYKSPEGGSDFGPYATANLTYTYAPESSFGIGFQEGRNASSLIGQSSTTNNFVRDTETSVLYASVVHRIVPKLYGSLKGTFQNSTYNGGGVGINGESDRFYEVEADLEYRFSPNFTVHGGYDYNRLISSLSESAAGTRDYDENRFYIGATAKY